MGDLLTTAVPVNRITCAIHHRLASVVRSSLSEIGIESVLAESGRNVRQVVNRRILGLPGSTVRIEDSPVDIFSCSVPESLGLAVMNQIIKTAELDTPGRGTVFVQNVLHYGPLSSAAMTTPSTVSDQAVVLNDLVLVTAILSMPGSGENLGRLALELGTCVPVISRATGTGFRDRLGLLRITIPADKDVVAFLVPAYDAEGVIRLLIEEMRLDRPGRGFVYQTPVHAARIDTRLRIGRQEHAASIEQIIAAIDDLTTSTAWRKRFASIERDGEIDRQQLFRNQREITVVCAEGNTGVLVEAALEAGAGGATTARVRNVRLAGEVDGLIAAERSVIHVSADTYETVVEAIARKIHEIEDSSSWMEVIESPVAFTHRG